MQIHEDEILYSYLVRLARANGYTDLKECVQLTGLIPMSLEPNNRYRTIRYEIQADLYTLLKSIDSDLIKASDLYLKTSLYPLVFPMSSLTLSSHRIGMLSRYRIQSKLITPLNDIYRDLKFCPMCRKEDEHEHGEWYYRRSHQIPNVTACYRHGCPLCRYEGEADKIFDADQPVAVLEKVENSHEYAIFAHDFLHAELQVDIAQLAAAVLARMSHLGYSKYKCEDMHRKMGAYATLLTGSLQSFFRYFPNKSQTNIVDCLTLLLYLFGDVETLRTYLNETDSSFSTELFLQGQYELISTWNESLIELRCLHCGNPFLTTPYRIRSGWGCPECDHLLGDEQLLQRLFDHASGGGYDLLSFSGFADKLVVRHKACGREYAVRTRSFLEEQQRCQCSRISTTDEILRSIALCGNFDLLQFQPDTSMLEIKHRDCGTVFHQKYTRHRRQPVCPACKEAEKRPNSEDFAQKIFDLVGKSYVLESKYEGPKKQVQIRHCECNTVQTYMPGKFLRGTRCSVCHQRLTYTEFVRIVQTASFGRYASIEQVDPDMAIILDNETGERRTMKIKYVMQELFRITPSSDLPLEQRNLDVSMPQSIGKRILKWLTEHYKTDEPIVLKKLSIEDIPHKTVMKTLNNLYRAGKLDKLSYGVYVLKGEDNAKDY